MRIAGIIIVLASATLIAPVYAQTNTFDVLVARNLMENNGGDCEVREFFPMTDLGYEYLQGIVASPDLEHMAYNVSDKLMQDCNDVFAYLEKTNVLVYVEGEAAIFNHPLMQQQRDRDSEVMAQAYKQIFRYLDENM